MRLDQVTRVPRKTALTCNRPSLPFQLKQKISEFFIIKENFMGPKGFNKPEITNPDNILVKAV